MTEKIAVILSGCGVYDGSEVHEASAACAAISRAGKLYKNVSTLFLNLASHKEIKIVSVSAFSAVQVMYFIM